MGLWGQIEVVGGATPDMSESDVDTSRTVVRTYVPAYQRDEWDSHAEDLDMSRSEFVRTMVQAGRRGFGDDIHEPGEDSETSQESDDSSLDDQIRSAIDENGPLTWDELLSSVTGDIERRLDESIQRLQNTNEIRYSGRDDGYVLQEQ